MKTYEKIRKIVPGQGDDYSTGCLLDYNYFMDRVNFKFAKIFLLILKNYGRPSTWRNFSANQIQF